MNWTAIRKSYFHMENRSWNQLAGWRRFDRRHYVDQDRIYTDWLASLRPAGVIAPNLMVACFMWLAGVVMAWLLPPKWNWLLVLVTLGWMARGLSLRQAHEQRPAERVREGVAIAAEAPPA